MPAIAERVGSPDRLSEILAAARRRGSVVVEGRVRPGAQPSIPSTDRPILRLRLRGRPRPDGVFLLDVLGSARGQAELRTRIRALRDRAREAEVRDESLDAVLRECVALVQRRLAGAYVLFDFTGNARIDRLSYRIARKLVVEGAPFGHAFLFDRALPRGGRPAAVEGLCDRLLLVAEILSSARMHREADALLAAVARRAGEIRDPSLLGRLRFREGMASVRRGRPDRGRRLYAAAAAHFSAAPSADDLVKTLNNLANVEISLGRFEEARATCMRALAVAEERQNDFAMGVVYDTLGCALLRLDRPDEALEHIRMGLFFLARSGHFYRVQLAYNYMGDAYRALGRRGAALAYYRKARALARLEGDRHDEGVSVLRMGRLHFDAGAHRACERAYREAAEILGEFGGRDGLVFVHESLGDLYAATGRRREAAEEYRRCLRKARLLRKESRIRRIRMKVRRLAHG